MKTTQLQAYKTLKEMFNQKGYSYGKKYDMPTLYRDLESNSEELKPYYYALHIRHCDISFWSVPEKYQTKEFFICAESFSNKDLIRYIQNNPTKFDKQFFKDCIATTKFALMFETNVFEYMPLEFIDEDMVTYAMLALAESDISQEHNCFGTWFFSVYKRKPEILTQELYTVAARCFGVKRNGKNELLDITPIEYRTNEYYLALCSHNTTPVMEDIPESVLTITFLIELLEDNIKNIQCFTENALEKKIVFRSNAIKGILPADVLSDSNRILADSKNLHLFKGTTYVKYAYLKNKEVISIWQLAVICDGHLIKHIPLNDERIEFFFSLYDKECEEYVYGLKPHYKQYLRQKNSTAKPKHNSTVLASLSTLAGASFGMDIEDAIDFGNSIMNNSTNRQTLLPIYNVDGVHREYRKIYDSEEYLVELYKKIGIEVLEEYDEFYYKVILPSNISVVKAELGYNIQNSNGETLMHYYDVGSFYDREVAVNELYISL